MCDFTHKQVKIIISSDKIEYYYTSSAGTPKFIFCLIWHVNLGSKKKHYASNNQIRHNTGTLKSLDKTPLKILSSLVSPRDFAKISAKNPLSGTAK